MRSLRGRKTVDALCASACYSPNPRFLPCCKSQMSANLIWLTKSGATLPTTGTDAALNITLIYCLPSCMMRSQDSITEVHLNSAWTRSAMVSVWIAGVIALHYLLRIVMADIPFQDHVMLLSIIGVLLASAWATIDQVSVRISLAQDCCWVRHHRFGATRQRSIPVTQIHSARTELCPDPEPGIKPKARIVLITSLGKIPVCEPYFLDHMYTQLQCETINQLLGTQSNCLAA